MNRITNEAILPRPKLFYTTRELLVWSLWLVSIVVGALAVAVVSFVLTHHEYALYEATHENFATFMFEALPYLWLITFGVMAVVAVYNLKHTKHGYRYPLWQIFGSSVLCSVVGGLVLHFFDFGHKADYMLGQQVAMYPSEEKRDREMWGNPAEGRLIGNLTQSSSDQSEDDMLFVDMKGNLWKLNTHELSEDELQLLREQKTVRLVGVAADSEENVFYSCGVFPWLADKPMSQADFRSIRKAFEMKMQSFEERIETATSVDVKSQMKPGEENVCGQLESVHRVERGSRRRIGN